MEEQRLINIPELLEKKLKKNSKYVPGFVVRYLERIIHVEEVNYVLKSWGNLRGREFIKKYLGYFDLKIKTVGETQIPKDQRYIFAANHPMGSHDGVLMIEAINLHFGKNQALVNDLLAEIKPLGEYFIPINKVGKQNKENARLTDQLFNSENHVVMYPSGMVSRRTKGVIADLEWKKTIITRAKRHKLAIVPVHISGRNSNFFYNFSNMRKWLGIKFPIEMVYLFDEMFNKKGETLTYTFGKPIPYETFDKSALPQVWADKLRAHTYKLPDNPELDFQ